jgi:hypothetical protein
MNVSPKGFFDAYLSNAWPFAVVHGVLLVVVLSFFRGLVLWKPARGERPLAEFDSRTQHLRGVIGLFLLVGIAGTFYALWGLRRGLEGREISEALAPAFPVGLVGLALTFVFSLSLDFYESRKRLAIELDQEGAAASPKVQLQRAIDRLPERLAIVLREDRLALTQEIDSGIQSIRGALEPVADLQGTLSRTLEPVVRQLAASLDQATGLLRAQGERLNADARTLADAANALGAAAEDTRSAVSQLSKASASAVEGQRAAKKLIGETQETLGEARTTLATFAKTTGDLFRTVGEQLDLAGRGLEEALHGLRQAPEDLRRVLQGATDALRRETQDQLEVSLTRINEGIAGGATHLVGVLDQCQKQVEEIVGTTQSAFAHLNRYQEQVAAQTREAIVNLSSSFAEAVQERATTALLPLDQIAAAAASSRISLEQGEARLQVGMSDLQIALSDQMKQVVQGSGALTDATRRVALGFSDAAGVLSRSARDLDTSLGSLNRAPSRRAERRRGFLSRLFRRS